MRYYYKSKTNIHFLNLKSPIDDEEKDDYIQITEEEFKAIKKSKKHEPTEEEKEAKKLLKQFAEYKKYLRDTDYIVLKLGEALSEGDTDSVTAIKTEYAEQLAKRKEAREKINGLEVK